MPGMHLPILRPSAARGAARLRAAPGLELQGRDHAPAGRVPRGAAAASSSRFPTRDRAVLDGSRPHDASPACPACGARRRSTSSTSSDGIPVAQLPAARRRARRRAASHAATSSSASAAACGFITNTAFDPALHDYSVALRGDAGLLAALPRVRRRARRALGRALRPARQDVLEIGCGKGEFLVDDVRGRRRPAASASTPACVPSGIDSRRPPTGSSSIEDFYAERYAHLDGRRGRLPAHARAHRPGRASSCSIVRRAIGDRPDTVVLFELPGRRARARRGARSGTSTTSTARTSPPARSRGCSGATGFEVLDLELDYDDQYLADRGAARPTGAGAPVARRSRTTSSELRRRRRPASARGFAADRGALAAPSSRAARADGRRAVIWGAGSKGVAFLTTLGLERRDRATPSTSTRSSRASSWPAPATRSSRPSACVEYRPGPRRRDEPDLPRRDRRRAPRARRRRRGDRRVSRRLPGLRRAGAVRLRRRSSGVPVFCNVALGDAARGRGGAARRPAARALRRAAG